MKSVNKIIFLIAIIAASACSKINSVMDSTEAIPEKMNLLNKGMSDTNESIRLQKLAIALEQVMNEKNQSFLSPIPGDMMGPGKLLAESLTAEEAVKLIYVKLVNVNENTYRDQFPDDSELKNIAQIQSFERTKIAIYYAVQIIATFLPDQIINEIVETQIKHGGRFYDVGLQILMMRVSFYDKVMLHASLFKDTMKTVGMVSEAIEYNKKIDAIAKFKFANRIGIKITGFSNQAQNEAMSEKLDVTVAAKNWTTILDRASREVEILGISGNEAEDKAEIAREKSVLEQNIAIIQNYLSTWPAVQP